MKKLSIITLLLLTTFVLAKELPSWGMTESQFNLPNSNTKMQEIGNQALKNNWLLKVTAPQEWHNKIRSGLSREGQDNVQINFNDSLYKSITITAATGMEIKNSNTESTPTAIVKKQIVIEKPEMDTNIEAPEFDNSSFKAGELLNEIGELELTLPNGQNLRSNSINTNTDKESTNNDTKQQVKSDDKSTKVITKESDSPAVAKSKEATAQEQRKASEQNLRMRYARGKAVDKSISYNNITDKDDLYVEGAAVLVKRYVNRGVAIYYWMSEDYNPQQHSLDSKGSGKYQKLIGSEAKQVSSNAAQKVIKGALTDKTQEDNPNNDVFDFIAVTDQTEVQNKLRRDFIRNKVVTGTLKSSQLSKGDILYVSSETVLVERLIGNSQSTYYWLVGETNISQEMEYTGHQKYVIK